jgi:hypothetical protein
MSKAKNDGLTREEISLIAEDCEVALKSFHVGRIEECEDVAKCPPDHFDWGDSKDETLLRQNLLKKLDQLVRKR